MNRLTDSKEIESVAKICSHTKIQDKMASEGNSTKYLEMS